MNSATVTEQTRLPVQQRLEWVDYARGIAILLVVYRHSLVGLKRAGTEVSAGLYAVQEFLYNVRMPVFFVLSGIFLAGSLLKYSSKTVAGKKAATLLYPYFIWSVLLISLQWLLADYTNSDRTARDYLYILIQPRELDHMWYLLALFNTSILYILLHPLFSQRPLLHLILATGLHFLSFYLGPWSFFSDIAYHYIFLLCGVLVAGYVKKWDTLPVRKIILFLVILLPVFIAGQLYWLRSTGTDYTTENWWELGPFLLIILVACIVYYLVSRLLQNWGKAKWLEVVGKHSLYIYILHIHVIAFIRIVAIKLIHLHDARIILAISMVLGILIPIWLYKMTVRLGWNFLFSAPQKLTGK